MSLKSDYGLYVYSPNPQIKSHKSRSDLCLCKLDCWWYLELNQTRNEDSGTSPSLPLGIRHAVSRLVLTFFFFPFAPSVGMQALFWSFVARALDMLESDLPLVGSRSGESMCVNPQGTHRQEGWALRLPFAPFPPQTEMEKRNPVAPWVAVEEKPDSHFWTPLGLAVLFNSSRVRSWVIMMVPLVKTVRHGVFHTTQSTFIHRTSYSRWREGMAGLCSAVFGERPSFGCFSSVVSCLLVLSLSRTSLSRVTSHLSELSVGSLTRLEPGH